MVQRFKGYKESYTGSEYYFQFKDQPRLSAYSGGFFALSFIDNINNNAIFCLLEADGTASSVVGSNGDTLISATDLDHFDSQYPLNSIAIHKTSAATSIWTYVWISSGLTSPFYNENQSMVHGFKMNKMGHTQYLGSTNLPRNTDYYFHNLTNLALVNDYYDVYTMENWTDNYGLRKYLPYADIHSDLLHTYCIDSADYMRWEATFTNDCLIQLSAERKNINNGWDSVKFNYILNDGDVNMGNPFEPILYENAGYTEVDLIRIQLDLPIQDYALGDSIRLYAKLYPDWANESDLGSFPYSIIERTYNGYVKKTCLPRPGGCPFLYYKDTTNTYKADNNILHRSEFSGSGDITDEYKLRYPVQIASNTISLSLVENENDNGYINMVKLFAVDYPTNRVMGLTENNTIVLYDTGAIVASDSVMLGSTNITSNVNFHHPGATPTNGLKTDSLYAHFSYGSGSNKKVPITTVNRNNLQNKNRSINPVYDSKASTTTEGPGSGTLTYAFISELGNLKYPIASSKDTGGVLIANSIFSNATTKIFSRRENLSTVILPLFGDSNKIANFTIKWKSDFQMRTLGVTTLEYSGYTSTEIILSKAHYITATLDSGITSALTAIDTSYGLVNSSAVLTMLFDVSGLSAPSRGNQRSYIVEINGHYTTGSETKTSKIQSQVPLVYKLSQNYPNPFNPTTKINYEIPTDTKVKLVIYDVLGREVIKLVNNDFKKAGRYTAEFDGKNFASGVYFYRIEAGTFIESKKMVLIK